MHFFVILQFCCIDDDGVDCGVSSMRKKLLMVIETCFVTSSCMLSDRLYYFGATLYENIFLTMKKSTKHHSNKVHLNKVHQTKRKPSWYYWIISIILVAVCRVICTILVFFGHYLWAYCLFDFQILIGMIAYESYTNNHQIMRACKTCASTPVHCLWTIH